MHEMKGEHKTKYVEKFLYSERTRDLLPLKDDRVIFKMDENVKKSGIVSSVYANGRVNIRVNGKVVKSHRSEIVENLTIDAAMLDINKKFSFKYYLYNILTNEMYEIRSTIPRLKQMVELLVYNKYMIDNRLDDATFLKQMIDSVKNY